MKLKLKRIKVDKGFHYHVKLEVNGVKGNFVLDTGASNTVMDVNKIKIFNVKPKKSNNTTISAGIGKEQLTTLVSEKQALGFGKTIIKSRLVLIDLTFINQSYQKLKIKPVDGILGCDLLVNLKAVIDIPNKNLILKR